MFIFTLPCGVSKIKHFGIKIYQYLNWQDHIKNIAIKLNKANAMLHKVRQFVNEKNLISIYHTIFDSHLNYASIVWGQTKSLINWVFIIQKKGIRTIHFRGRFDHTSSLFSESNKIKLRDKIYIENCLFVRTINCLKFSIIGLFFLLIQIDMKHHVLRKVCLK